MNGLNTEPSRVESFLWLEISAPAEHSEWMFNFMWNEALTAQPVIIFRTSQKRVKAAKAALKSCAAESVSKRLRGEIMTLKKTNTQPEPDQNRSSGHALTSTSQATKYLRLLSVWWGHVYNVGKRERVSNVKYATSSSFSRTWQAGFCFLRLKFFFKFL